jgi:hypothetical protein
MKPDGGSDDSDPAQQVFHAAAAAFAGEIGLERLGRVARVHKEGGQRRHGMVLQYRAARRQKRYVSPPNSSPLHVYGTE